MARNRFHVRRTNSDRFIGTELADLMDDRARSSRLIPTRVDRNAVSFPAVSYARVSRLEEIGLEIEPLRGEDLIVGHTVHALNRLKYALKIRVRRTLNVSRTLLRDGGSFPRVDAEETIVIPAC